MRERQNIILMGCVIVLTIALLAPQSSQAGEHFRRCGDARGLGVEISAGGVSCRRSRRIIKSYFQSGPSITIVPVKGFPGWRCSSGDAGGSCAHGKYLSGVPEINFFYLKAPGRQTASREGIQALPGRGARLHENNAPR